MPGIWSLRTPKGRLVGLPLLPTTIGSGADADVTLAHASIDPVHAALSEIDGMLAVAAIGDAVVGVDGQRVLAGRVAPGGTLVLGKVRFEVLCRPEQAVSAGPEPLRRGRLARPGEAPVAAATMANDQPGSGTSSPRSRSGHSSLLGADMAQLGSAPRLTLTLLILAFAAGLVWGVSQLVLLAS